MGFQLSSLLRPFSRDRETVVEEVAPPLEPPPKQPEKVEPVNKIVLAMEDKAYAEPPADKMVKRSRNKGRKSRKAKE
jgi:hypothetical protein